MALDGMPEVESTTRTGWNRGRQQPRNVPCCSLSAGPHTAYHPWDLGQVAGTLPESKVVKEQVETSDQGQSGIPTP